MRRKALVRTLIMLVATLAILAQQPAHAQDISGTWQGTIMDPRQPLRTILNIAKADGGGWNASLLSVSQTVTNHPIVATTVTLQESVLKVTFGLLGGVYEGRVETDGSLKGIWSQRADPPFRLDYQRVTTENAWKNVPHHEVRFVTVERDVRLEVLDWGGSGRPVVLLAGLGSAAHTFDAFAPKLATSYHVYGITRRGYGASSMPDAGYSADTLGDDVLAVLDSLSLTRPVLAGHSIAGQELSSVGSRHPERVAGLIYLDAGYSYAYYDSTFESSLRAAQNSQPAPATPGALPPAIQAMPPASRAIMLGSRRYTSIRAPVLAIYAFPHRIPPAMANDTAARTRFLRNDSATTGLQAAAFERGVPSARVVRIPDAAHNVFRSNEAEVLREMRAFIDALPRP